jgi:hypothetical protein
MGRGRGRQRDLFDAAPQVAELRHELRNTVAMLLQALLVEAAGLGRRQIESTDREEVGDDQDYP